MYVDLKAIAQDTLKCIQKETFGIRKLQWSPMGIAQDKEYRETFEIEKKPGYGVELVLDDSVSAARKLKAKACILNFASAKTPGGGFLTGARAQEESLCRCGTLYMHLVSHEDLYEWSNEHLNKGVYSTWAIYSPEVSMFKDGKDYSYRNEFKCSVITSPAVNAGAARRHQVSQSEIDKAMRERIEHIFKVAAINEEKNLVLGAFGCGVFKNDPKRVAEIFLDVSFDYRGYFERVIFAIPSKDANYEAFKSVFDSGMKRYEKYMKENNYGN